MGDEPTPLPTTFERLLRHLTAALKSQTNATLANQQSTNEVRQQLASVNAKLDHLIATEATEATDVREIRAFLFDASQRLTETSEGVKATGRRLEEISDHHRVPTSEELAREEDARRWQLLKATAKFFRDHWPHITISGGLGAAAYHFIQRLFHLGG